MKDIHIYFCDFWDGFNKNDNIFIGVLKNSYNVIIDSKVDNDTDIIICSCFAREHLNYVGFKKIIYYSGENDFPTYLDYDYAITHNVFKYDRHLRLPLWVSYNYDYIQQHGEGISDLKPMDKSACNRKFCADVISNTNCAWPVRFKVSDTISNKYKAIDHGGSYKNNVGGNVGDKLDFFNNYKFSIASENSLVDGYVTEKIYDSFMSRTIPIYLGTDYVFDDFNKDAFINVSNFKTFDELIAKIREIDENDDLYMKMINIPPLMNKPQYEDRIDELSRFLTYVIEHGTIRCHKYGRIGLYYQRKFYN
ncbi:MAG: hypothetical protein [Wendovervirus sonii]|uniref:Alpha-(1,3)-fucosyltransferase FucT N-terminal domain-containing protein n=1 Tax=phage Lak_Megaphage_Sonny TaxID=3109229 RepID=A0ABZ0Z6R9_9CAUD|nr:MAG: hypothetical protein [phage Lak_Megaphage_Sonny]